MVAGGVVALVKDLNPNFNPSFMHFDCELGSTILILLGVAVCHWA